MCNKRRGHLDRISSSLVIRKGCCDLEDELLNCGHFAAGLKVIVGLKCYLVDMVLLARFCAARTDLLRLIVVALGVWLED